MHNTKDTTNVITIPHGGITREQMNDAHATLCDLLDNIERVGVENAKITKSDESAIRLCVHLLAQGNGDESNVITIPHGGIADDTQEVITIPHGGIIDKASR